MAFSVILVGYAQSPTDGRVESNAYANSYFHFSYSWPKILEPYDTGSLMILRKSTYNNEFLLFSARQGNAPYGVIILAERLNFPTPHSKGIKDAAQMMDMITKFSPGEHAIILTRKHFTSSNGLVFDQMEYIQNGVYSQA